MRLALVLLKSKRREFQEYDEKVATWKVSRNGLRTQAPYQTCIHGITMFGNRHIPCPDCMDGHGKWDYLFFVDWAIMMSRYYFQLLDDRRMLLQHMQRVDFSFTVEHLAWVIEPVTQHLKGNKWTPSL